MKTMFWEESPGNQSANRLIFIIGSLWLMFLTTYIIVEKLTTITEVGIFFATIFGLLAGTKLIQKNQEMSKDKNSIENKIENTSEVKNNTNT